MAAAAPHRNVVVAPQRSRSQRPPLGAAARHLEQISDTLTRLYHRIEGKLAETRITQTEATDLVNRAERLNTRLDVLRRKLRLAFETEGCSPPMNLTTILQNMADVDADDAPCEFVCPISQCLMVDPVRTCDGQVYDRGSIVEWFATFLHQRTPTSPLTNLPLSNIDLTPVIDLRHQIQKFIAERQRGGEGGRGGTGKPAIAATQGLAVASIGSSVKSTASAANHNNEREQQQRVSVSGEEPSRRAYELVNGGRDGTNHQQPTTSTTNDRRVRIDDIRYRPSYLDDARELLENESPDDRHAAMALRLGESAAANTRSRDVEATVAGGRQRSGCPIWSSSVVPAGEDNSRALNLLRISEHLVVPDDMLSATTGGGIGGGAEVARGAVRQRRGVANSAPSTGALPRAAVSMLPPPQTTAVRATGERPSVADSDSYRTTRGLLAARRTGAIRNPEAVVLPPTRIPRGTGEALTAGLRSNRTVSAAVPSSSPAASPIIPRGATTTEVDVPRGGDRGSANLNRRQR